MNRYRFEVQECQELEVEANSREEARMKIINHEVDSILNCSCNELVLNPYISDGIEINYEGR